MAQLVPIYNGHPDVAMLTQDLRSYGVVIINTICATRNKHFETLQIEWKNVPPSPQTDPTKSLIHLACNGKPEQGYGRLDCYVNPSAYKTNSKTVRLLVAAAAQQWCTVGKPSRHLAVLLDTTIESNPLCHEGKKHAVSLPKPLKRPLKHTVERNAAAIVI